MGEGDHRFDDLLESFFVRLRDALPMHQADDLHNLQEPEGGDNDERFDPKEYLHKMVPNEFEALILFSSEHLSRSVETLVEMLGDLIKEYKSASADREKMKSKFSESISVVLHVLISAIESYLGGPLEKNHRAEALTGQPIDPLMQGEISASFTQSLSFLMELDFVDKSCVQKSVLYMSHLDFPFFFDKTLKILKTFSTTKSSDFDKLIEDIHIKTMPYLDYSTETLSQLMDAISLESKQFKKDTRMHVCNVLDRAVWIWIKRNAEEYERVVSMGYDIPISPESLFRSVYKMAGLSGKKKRYLFWPILTTILLVSPATTAKFLSGESKSKNNLVRMFALTELAEALGGKNLARKRSAATCYTKILTASTLVRTGYADIFRKILPPATKKVLRDAMCELVGHDSSYQDVLEEFLLASFRVELHEILEYILDAIESTTGVVHKHRLRTAFLQAFIKFSMAEGPSWNYKIGQSIKHAPRIRREFLLKPIAKIRGLAQMLENSTGGRIHEFSGKEMLKKREREIYDRDILELETISQILRLYTQYPEYSLFSEVDSFGDAVTYENDTRNVFYNLCRCLDGNLGKEVEVKAFNLIKRLTDSQFVDMWSNTSEDSSISFFTIYNTLIGELSNLCIKMNFSQVNNRLTKLHADLLLHLLESRLRISGNFGYYVDKSIFKTSIAGVTKTETALFCLMVNVDSSIVSYGTRALIALANFVRLRFRDTTEDIAVFIDNIKYYEGMDSSRDNRIVGRAAQQSAIKHQLQMITVYTEGLKNSWNIIHEKWKDRTRFLSSTREYSMSESNLRPWETAYEASPGVDMKSEFLFWKNMLGFLISFSAPDKDSMAKYIRKLLRLAVCRNKTVSEAVTEEFSFTSPSAFSLVFDAVEKGLAVCVIDRKVELSETNTLFVSKVIQIIGQFFDIGAGFVHLSALNLEDLFLSLTRYVSIVEEVEVKIQYAHLVTKMLENSDNLLFKRELEFKNVLLAEMSQWLYQFRDFDKTGKRRLEMDMNKVDKLDLAVMEALSKLLDGLLLQKPNSKVNNSSVRIKERRMLFHEYFVLFSTTLEVFTSEDNKSRLTAEEQEMISYTVKALSNMLNANLGVGLTQMLPMGYASDLEIRKEFIDVFVNILRQGTEFQKLEETDEDRYRLLLHMLYSGIPKPGRPSRPGFAILDAVIGVISATEIDKISRVLCDLYMIPGFELDLIDHLIEEEEKWVPLNQPETLFRRNVVVTMLSSYYMTKIGKEYLRQVLAGPIKELIRTVGNNILEIEIEPHRLKSALDKVKGFIGMTQEEIQSRNQERVAHYFNVFVQSVLDSIGIIPDQIFQISNFLYKHLSKRFPDYVLVSIAGFFFLRFLVPAITAPEKHILEEGTVISFETRRGLLLVAKSIQKLANRTRFNEEEPHMLFMNSYIAEKADTLLSFSEVLANTEISTSYQSSWYIDFSDRGTMNAVHEFHKITYRHIDDFSVYFQKMKEGKQYSKFVSVLRELGNPKTIETNESSSADTGDSAPGSLDNRLRNENKRYVEFIIETKRHDFGDVRKEYGEIFFLHDESVRVFYLDASKLYQNLDFFRFSYYVLELIRQHTNSFRGKFFIAIDGSRFTAKNRIDKKSLNKFRKLLPNALVSSFRGFHVLCPTTIFGMYLNKLGIKFGKNATCHTDKKSFLLSANLSERAYPPHFSFPHLGSNSAAFSDCRVAIQPFKRMLSTIYIFDGAVYIHTVRDTKYQTLDNIRVENIISIQKSQDDSDSFDIKALDDESMTTISIKSDKRDAIIKVLEGYRFKLGLVKGATVQEEVTIRPQDVPGSLLNIGFLNIGSKSEPLRKSAYNLLAALAETFDYSVKDSLKDASDGLIIPQGNNEFIVNLSRVISVQERQITAEFLSEATKHFYRIGTHGRFLVLDYITPWFDNLEMIADEEVFNSLIDGIIEFTLTEKKLYPTILETVWVALSAQTKVYIRIFRRLMSNVNAETLEKISQIAISFSLNNKILMSNYLMGKVTDIFAEINEGSNEDSIETLEIYSQILLNLSFENGIVLEKNLPDLFIAIASSMAVRSYVLRKNMLSVLVNIIHSLLTNKVKCGRFWVNRLVRIKREVGSISFRLLFVGVSDSESRRDLPESTVHNIQSVCTTLVDIVNCFPDMREWKTDLIRIVANSVFGKKNSTSRIPVILLGALVRSPGYARRIMDRMLKLLFTSIKSKTVEETNSLLTSLGTLVRLDLEDNTYKAGLGWVAISILSVGPNETFQYALEILRNVIMTKDENVSVRRFFLDALGSMKKFDAVIQIYEKYIGLNFRDGFEVSLASILLQGMRDRSSRYSVVELLKSILRMEFSLGKSESVIVWIISLVPVLAEAEIIRIVLESTTSDDLDVAQMDRVGDFLYGLGIDYDKKSITIILHYLSLLSYVADSDERRLIYISMINKSIKEHGEELYASRSILFETVEEIITSSRDSTLKVMALETLRFLIEKVDKADSTPSGGDSVVTKLGFTGLVPIVVNKPPMTDVKKANLLRVTTNLLKYLW